MNNIIDKREKLNVCLLNDSFPPVIDGVANTVFNYAVFFIQYAYIDFCAADINS